MVEVSYYCPYCGAVTSVDRAPQLRDGSVTRRPEPDREYAATTDDLDAAEGIEFVCLGDVGPSETGAERTPAEPAVGRPDGPIPGKDGCGRTFYLNYHRAEPGWLDERRT